MAATIAIKITTDSDGGLDKAKRQVADLGETARSSGGGFSALGEIATGALRRVGESLVNVTALGVQALGKFAADSVTAAGDFEAAVNGLAAVSGDSLAKAGFDLESVSAKALQLGADTQFSAQEAIQAMTELAKGGVPIQSVMTDATDATLALAAAAGTELATSAEIVAKQLGVWSETGVTAAQVTDLLAGAANASTVGVEDLAVGLANAGGTAKTAGVSFEDMVQTMALIAPNFSSASDAGTSFKTFISRLIPTTDPATEAMAQLGLYTEEAGSAFFDAQGQFVGMEEASRLLQAATAGLSEEEKLLAFNTIFGADAIRAASAIANAGAEGYNAMGQAIADSGGAAESAAIRQQGFAFAIETLKGSFETLQIVIGTKILPLLTPLIGQITAGVNAAMNLASAIFDAGVGSTEFYEALGPLNEALGLAPGTLGTVYDMGVQVAGALQTLGSQAVPIAQMAFANLSAFLAAVMPSIVGIVTSALTTMAAFWQEHGATIITVAQSTWQMIVSVFQIAVGVIQGVFAIFAAALTGDWTTMGVQLTQANELIWTGIRGFLEGFLEGVLALFGTNLDSLIGTWQYNLDMIPVAAQVAIDGAIAAFESALGLAPGVGKAIIEGIASGISSATGKLASAAVDAARRAFEAAKNFLDSDSPSKLFANEVGLPIAQGMALGIQAGAPMVASAGAGLGQAAVQGAASTYNQQRSVTYAPTINNYGRPSDGLDYTTAVSLAGV